MLLRGLILCCVVLLAAAQRDFRGRRPHKPQFRVAYEWKLLDFEWTSENAKRAAIANREYIPLNNLITGVEFYNNRLFLTVPRMRNGVPATLTWVPAPNATASTAPLLQPFPSWEANRVGDCRALQNVQSVEIDLNGVLWVLDGGRSGTMEQYPAVGCPPRLVLYDLLRNDAVLREYIFPDDVALHDGSFLNDLVIDDFNGRFAYITDNSGIDPGLIVYSFTENTSWKVRESTTMRAAPDASQFSVNGTRVNVAINLDGIALGPVAWGPDRDLFYTPLSSYHIYAISSAVLRNRQLSTSQDVASYIRDVGTKSSTTDGMIMDQNGVLYYGLLGDNAVGYWNTSLPFNTGQKLLAKDSVYIQWPDSFSIDPYGNLYLLTNRIQNFLARTVRASEVNYRILYAHIGAASYMHQTYGADALAQTPTFSTTLAPQGRSLNDDFRPSTPYIDIISENGLRPTDGTIYYADGTVSTPDSLRVENPLNAGNKLSMGIISILATVTALIFSHLVA